MAEYEAGICACGFHISQTDTDEHDSEIELPVCKSCAYVARYQRMLAAAEDEKRGEKPNPGRYDPADGRRVILTYKGKAQPVSKVAENEGSSPPLNDHDTATSS